MPEPNTLTNPPDGPKPPEGSTAGWVQAPAPAADPAADGTRTLPPRSTPGPLQPDRATAAEAARRDDDPDTAGELPKIVGLRIEKLIGRGGMGRVYRATHLELNKVVALKLITTAGRDEDAVRGRFEREVQALARIDHPNIVPVYHAGHWHGFPYFTMKFVPGGALSQHLPRFVSDSSACARLVTKVARAVQALHDAGVVHRDLKPLNILLGEHDEPLVADFGLAKWLDEPGSDLTITHLPMGTRQYMAPEQTLGLRGGFSPACDIWALGVMLYELLAGVRPFPDDGSSDLYERIRTADPPPLPASVPAGLASVIDRCLAKKPEERYPSAAAVAADLDRWRAGEVLPAAPVRRRPAPLWARTLGVCALLALITLPAVLIPWGRADADPAKPAPAIRLRSIAEQLVARQVVRLTNAKGKPLVPVADLEHFTMPWYEDKDGSHTFTTRTVAAVELVNERLPLPVRLDAEVEVSANVSGYPFAGVYLGRREWLGTRKTGQSFTRLAISPVFGNGRPTNLHCSAMGYWWPEGQGGNNFPLGNQYLPFEPPQQGHWKSTISVEIYPDALVATIHGQPLPRITSEQVITRLGDQLRMRKDLAIIGDFNFAPPAFGTGIGITLGSSDAVIRNLTLTPLQR